MKKRFMKIATISTAAVALVVVTVLVTVAYLTSFSTVSNTFSVGRVGIQMYESAVDTGGVAIADTDKNGSMKDSSQNHYTLIPGKTYAKDPTIYVDKDSADSFLFVTVLNEIASIEAEGDASVAAQMLKNGWKKLEGVTSSKGDVYYYAKNSEGQLADDAVSVLSNGVGYDVFSTFSIKNDAVVRDYNNKKIELTAYAIQADTFTTGANAEAATSAWQAIVQTYPEAGAVTP